MPKMPWVLAVTLLWAPGAALGQSGPVQAPNRPPSGGTASTPQGASTYEVALLTATRKLVLRDFGGAVATLRDAATQEGRRPEAFCLLGDAQLALSDLPEARAAYESCARFADADRSHALTVALVGLARVLSREKKPREEREAWQKVASASREPAALSLASDRMRILDAQLAQQSGWEQVRARIAEHKSKAAEPAAK